MRIESRTPPGDGAGESGRLGNACITTESTAWAQCMHRATYNGFDAEPAGGHDAARSHGWRGEGWGELRQRKSVPSKRAAGCLSDRACELVGRVEVCPNDQQLFRWGASHQPSPGTSNAAMTREGGAGGGVHIPDVTL